MNTQANHKSTYRSRYLPWAYVRLIHQFSCEVIHGQHNQAHEAQRRASYAQGVLNHLGLELEKESQLESPGVYASAWRSKTLTPILQRNLQGIPDSYAPSVHAGVLDPNEDANDEESEDLDREMTISNATRFYLSQDPTIHTELYLRNSIYLPEARWHMAVATGKIAITDPKSYNQIQENQDLLANPDDIVPGADVPGSMLPFTTMELVVLMMEGISDKYPLCWTGNVGIVCAHIQLLTVLLHSLLLR